jgi:hypothetical protein
MQVIVVPPEQVKQLASHNWQLEESVSVKELELQTHELGAVLLRWARELQLEQAVASVPVLHDEQVTWQRTQLEASGVEA